MPDRPRPDRPVGELAGLRLGKREQLLDTGHAERRMHRQDERQARERGDRGEILAEVEAEIGAGDRVGDVRQRADEQCVAVRRRARDELRTDARAGARPRFDHDLLAERPAHAVTDQSRGDIGRRSRREADDQPNGPLRIALGFSLRHGGDGGQRQGQCANGNALHGSPPWMRLVLSNEPVPPNQPLCVRFARAKKRSYN